MFLLLAFLVTAAVVGVAASSSSSSGGSSSGPTANPPGAPLVSTDAVAAYMAKIANEKAKRDAAAASDAAAADARNDDIKSIAKYIPILGGAWTSLVDLGAWFGKKLGSAYGEENAPEDIQHVADEVAKYLRAGWLPPNPDGFFTGKVGAKSLGNQMQSWREMAEDLSGKRWPASYLYNDIGMSTAAIRAIGALTLKWGADPRIAPLVSAVASSTAGTINNPEVQGGGKIPPVADLAGALVAVETGADVATIVAKARAAFLAEDLATVSGKSASTGYKQLPNPNPLPNQVGSYAPPFPDSAGGLGTLADVFVRMLREASSSSSTLILLAR